MHKQWRRQGWAEKETAAGTAFVDNQPIVNFSAYEKRYLTAGGVEMDFLHGRCRYLSWRHCYFVWHSFLPRQMITG